MMLVIVDYKMGNIGSIVNMLRKLGQTPVVSPDPEVVASASALIIPGVGAFDHGMNNLRAMGLQEVLEQKVKKDRVPVLGICLGLQLMTRGSEEGGQKGLGWFDAETVRFRFSPEGENQQKKVPHMGWNGVRLKKESRLFRQPDDEQRFYFVHSFHVVSNDRTAVVAETSYGYEFPSILEKENVSGVQFHPEKSHKYGMQLLNNFCRACS